MTFIKLCRWAATAVLALGVVAPTARAQQGPQPRLDMVELMAE